MHQPHTMLYSQDSTVHEFMHRQLLQTQYSLYQHIYHIPTHLPTHIPIYIYIHDHIHGHIHTSTPIQKLYPHPPIQPTAVTKASNQPTQLKSRVVSCIIQSVPDGKHIHKQDRGIGVHIYNTRCRNFSIRTHTYIHMHTYLSNIITWCLDVT